MSLLTAKKQHVKILYLTNPKAENLNQLPEFMRKYGDLVEIYYDKINSSFLEKSKPEFIVSDRYPFLFSEDVMRILNGNIVNLHSSFLPWNKGYHSNFWSIYHDTPKGNTIHYVDKGIDTGDIAFQSEIFFSDEDTLKTTYYKLRANMVNLFFLNWLHIRNKKVKRKKQTEKGSIHYKKEFERFFNLLLNGWDTQVKDIKKSISIIRDTNL